MFALLRPLLHALMWLAGLRPQTIEIEPGTLMHIWVPKQTISETKTQNRTIYVPPTKPDVLLVHFFAFDAVFTWIFQVLALTGKYSVYVPDLLFFGGSITNKPDRSVSFQAEFLTKGLKKLSVEKCTVVGVSYGGVIGFKMAKLYPELVESMVVSGTVIELTESISISFYRRLGFSQWSDLLLPETVEGLISLISVGTHEFPWLPDFVYSGFLQVFGRNQKERGELLEALVVCDKDVADSTYPQRIHLLWGEHDKIFNLDIAQQMKEKLGEKSTLHFVKNAGHLVHLERPFAYNCCLNHILSSLEKT